MSNVQKLSELFAPISRPINTKSSIRDTPVTMSGFIIGMFVTVFKVVFQPRERR